MYNQHDHTQSWLQIKGPSGLNNSYYNDNSILMALNRHGATVLTYLHKIHLTSLTI